jgi:hypothetical protein
MNNLVTHAQTELDRAGLLSPESDYDGMLGRAVLDLVRVFSEQGHSGYSAMATVDLFRRVASYESLGPITDDPDEWMSVADFCGGQATWQNRRRSSAFSEDGGKTYYLVDDRSRRARFVHDVWWKLPKPLRPSRLHRRVLQWPVYKSAAAS